MSLETSRDRLARALTRAAAEHGLPNGFSCGELEHYHGGPPARTSGRILRHYRSSLGHALEAEGLVVTDYDRGRIYLAAATEGATDESD